MKAAIGTADFASPVIPWARTADFLELTKPRITFLVVATTWMGFYLGIGKSVSPWLLSWTLIGTALVAAGASAFNMYLERGRDALMRRTLRRPLPAGRLHNTEAFLFALGISVTGMVSLWMFVNPLTSGLSVVTFLSYLFLYTPLKSRTWLCTVVGAVPGALPAPMGWAAVTGHLSLGAWVLFGIVFLWQLPHFYSIGWMYREDYARAGFPMLSVVDLDGSRTSRQSLLFTVLLVIASTLPSWMHISGFVYLAGALVLGAGFLIYAISFARTTNRASARKLFAFSVAYLPCLAILMMVDKALR